MLARPPVVFVASRREFEIVAARPGGAGAEILSRALGTKPRSRHPAVDSLALSLAIGARVRDVFARQVLPGLVVASRPDTACVPPRGSAPRMEGSSSMGDKNGSRKRKKDDGSTKPRKVSGLPPPLAPLAPRHRRTDDATFRPFTSLTPHPTPTPPRPRAPAPPRPRSASCGESERGLAVGQVGAPAAEPLASRMAHRSPPSPNTPTEAP